MSVKLTTLFRIFLIILLMGFFTFGSILLSFSYSNNFRTWLIEAIVNTEMLKLTIKGKTFLEIGWQPELTLNNISINNTAF